VYGCASKTTPSSSSEIIVLQNQKKRGFALFYRRFRVVRFSCRLCENSETELVNPIFAEIWPVLGDQKPTNRKNSL